LGRRGVHPFASIVASNMTENRPSADVVVTTQFWLGRGRLYAREPLLLRFRYIQPAVSPEFDSAGKMSAEVGVLEVSGKMR